MERLNESHESHMKRLSDTHREKVALLDRQFLQQKQQLMRAREAALWEMEERQLTLTKDFLQSLRLSTILETL